MEGLPALTRPAAWAIAVGRIAIGASFVIAPQIVGSGWAGEGARGTAGRLLSRSLGIRDMLLGVGLLNALRRGRGSAEWMWYGVLTDVVDAAGTAQGWRELPLSGRMMLPFTASAVVIDALVAARLD